MAICLQGVTGGLEAASELINKMGVIGASDFVEHITAP